MSSSFYSWGVPDLARPRLFNIMPFVATLGAVIKVESGKTGWDYEDYFKIFVSEQRHKLNNDYERYIVLFMGWCWVVCMMRFLTHYCANRTVVRGLTTSAFNSIGYIRGPFIACISI